MSTIQIRPDVPVHLRHAEEHDRLVFRVRTFPERYTEEAYQSVQAARASLVAAIGNMYDWDCYRCRRAVLTYSLDDPCPHCQSPDGVRPESSYRALGRAMWRNWQNTGA